jgi:hypothetical protein
VSVQFSVFARAVEGSEQIDMAASLRVLHRHQGLENDVFDWHDTYSAPLGSAQFASGGRW